MLGKKKEELDVRGIKVAFEKLMTYQEYFDSIDDSALYHDIDPNRLVWVITTKHTNKAVVAGYEVDKAVITTLHDAETGIQFDTTIRSEEPNGVKIVRRNQ